jgi:hypothetical protein
LDKTKWPLTRGFLAMHLISQAKTGLSASAGQRHIGWRQPTAGLLHHKFMTAMANRAAQPRRSSTVQRHGACTGGASGRAFKSCSVKSASL